MLFRSRAQQVFNRMDSVFYNLAGLIYTETAGATSVSYTPQRFAVMACLMEHNRHPTAAEIFEAVNRVDPRSSRATTYNNLRDLVQAGLVREVAVEGRAARFDAKGMRHHHFICDRCGNVEDIEWYDMPRPAPGSLGRRVLRECELIFRGFCARCAPRRASR